MRCSHWRIHRLIVLAAWLFWPPAGFAQVGAGASQVFGTVLDRFSGRPIPAAMVTLAPVGGGAEPLWTGPSDDSGRFRTEALLLGEYEITVAMTGFSELEGLVELEQPGPVDLRVQMVPADFALEPVIVLADRRPPLEEVGFYERLRFGDGHFVTREELDAHASMRISDVLRGLPGVRVLPGNTRTDRVLLRGDCSPQVVFDGSPVSGPVNVDDLVPTTDVAGIEVYHGASAPISYTEGPTCGVVMVWSSTPEGVQEQPDMWRRAVIIVGIAALTMLGLR